MEKTKILIVADVLGEANNGTSTTIKRLIEGLKKRNYQVYVVSPKNQNKEGYYTLKKRNFYFFNKYIKKNGVVLAMPDKKLLNDLISKVDIVHLELPFKTGKMAVKICQKLNKPFTAGFHCPAEAFTAHIGLKNFKLLNYFIYKRYYNQFYRHVNIVHCPTLHFSQCLKKMGYKNNFKIISNGVIPQFVRYIVEKPEKLKDKFCILYAGRLSVEKRHDLLIKAVKNSKYNSKIQLIFAGDGPTKQKLLKLSKGLINPPIIKFMEQKELIDTMNMCDLYVHCSDVETEGISCLEAISCGLVPVISNSNKCATQEFAVEKCNLFEKGDPTSLKNRIEFFIENPLKLKQLQKRYIEFSAQFEINKCIDQMCDMFEEAIFQNLKTKEL